MNIPIAKEFWNKACRTDELKSPADIMIEFAKLHVQAALKEASEKAELNYADGKLISPLSTPMHGICALKYFFTFKLQ